MNKESNEKNEKSRLMLRLKTLLDRSSLLPVVLAFHFSAFQSAMAASWITNTPMNLARDTPSTTLASRR
jgi:hypothetical protein